MKKPNNATQEPRSATWTEEQEKAYWHEVNKEYDEKEGSSGETANTNIERPKQNTQKEKENGSED
jgi:hypothetical protein